MSPSKGDISADVLRDQMLNGINKLKRRSYVHSHCVDFYNVANQEKGLVTAACVLTFAEKLF